ncbi:MAG: 2-C-methyl-D-erythritol 4-phosphate cytidylyltransferase [Angelakisella sp.]
MVLIQDGARPLVTERMLEDCLAALESGRGSHCYPEPGYRKLADEEGYAEATTDRSRTWLIQTPQAFTGRSCWRCTGRWAMGQKEDRSRMTACCWSAPADG